VSAIFDSSGGRLTPSVHATSFWAGDRLHGGPVLGLFARAVEAASPDPELICARLTVDMFRPVPHAPLEVRSEVVRQGARLAVVQCSLRDAQRELARATALLLRETAGSAAEPQAAPEPHQALATESLFRGRDSGGFPQGFHTQVQTRWPARRDLAQPLSIWFHMPLPLVAAEPFSAFQHAVAISDFANAVASIAGRERGRDAPYINADATLYLCRRPVGEWFCLQSQGSEEERGISLARVSIADERGVLGQVQQARVLFGR
jgi:hypothetical protein